MSAHNLMTLFKRTSLIVYDPDIFNCSRHTVRPIKALAPFFGYNQFQGREITR